MKKYMTYNKQLYGTVKMDEPICFIVLTLHSCIN